MFGVVLKTLEGVFDWFWYFEVEDYKEESSLSPSSRFLSKIRRDLKRQYVTINFNVNHANIPQTMIHHQQVMVDPAVGCNTWTLIHKSMKITKVPLVWENLNADLVLDMLHECDVDTWAMTMC